MNSVSQSFPLRRGRIVIADDDKAILDSLKLILEDENYEVETSLDGETLLKNRESWPDLILLDIWMSGTDGRDICMYLKKQKETRHIPIIMISANGDGKHIAKSAGADDFLAKPFEMQTLLTMVDKHITR